MRWPLWLERALLLGSCAAVTACGEESKDNFPDDVRWTSSHFRYHTRSGDESACIEVLDELERHFSILRDALGFAWPNGAAIDYFKFNGPRDYDANSRCPVNAKACTRGRTVRSWHPMQRHELIHAYLADAGDAPPLLAEGVAQAFSCGWQVFAAPNVDWRTAFEARPGSDDFAESTLPYTAGPWLVAHLIERYGATAFMSLYATVPFEATADDFDEKFQEIYGVSVTDEWQSALAEGSRNIGCIHAWECSGPPSELSDGPLQFEDSCSKGEDMHRFELGEGEELSWSDVFVPGAFSLKGCSPGNTAQFAGVAGSGDVGVAALEAGRYFVGVRFGSGQATLQKQTKLLSRECPPPAEFEVTRAPRAALIVPNASQPRYVRFSDSSPSSLVYVGDPETDVVVERCEACDGNCAAVPLDVALNDQLIRVSSSASDGYAVVPFEHSSPGSE